MIRVSTTTSGVLDEWKIYGVEDDDSGTTKSKLYLKPPCVRSGVRGWCMCTWGVSM